jgi:hypothetical protein
MGHRYELKCLKCGTTEPSKFFTENRRKCIKCSLTKEHKEKVKARVNARRKRDVLWGKYCSSKGRAKRYGIIHTVSLEYLRNLLQAQNNKCVYTNLEFDNLNSMKSLSIDRIDSSKGYIEGNVQFVLTCINFMKYEFTEEYFIEMCKLVYLNSL